MKRVILLGLVIVALGALAVAIVWPPFGGGPVMVRLSTGTYGGTYNAFGRALADTFDDGGNLSVDVIASAGANQNAQRLTASEADAALIQSDTPVGLNTLIAARLFPEAFHLVVRIGSGIETVNDLRGKRVGLMPEGAGSNALFERLLDSYELPATALTIVHGTLSDHAAAIESGEIDGFFMVVALGNATIERIIQSTPTQLLAIDLAEAMALFDPALDATTVPVGTYSGERPVPDSPISVVTVESLLAVRRGLPETTVERLTRGLFERRQAMARVLPQAAFVKAPTDEQRLAFGVHPGADRYYRQDDPLFVVEYAEPMALGVTALALLASGLWQGRILLRNARKNRVDHYNLEIIEILKRVESADTETDFAAIRADLNAIFEKVIVDLDVDRIEESSLPAFSFAWQAASRSLNHRELLARGIRDPGV